MIHGPIATCHQMNFSASNDDFDELSLTGLNALKEYYYAMRNSSYNNAFNKMMMRLFQFSMVLWRFIKLHGPPDQSSLAVAAFSTLLASGWIVNCNQLPAYNAPSFQAHMSSNSNSWALTCHQLHDYLQWMPSPCTRRSTHHPLYVKSISTFAPPLTQAIHQCRLSVRLSEL